MLSSWQTTLGGIILGIGVPLATTGEGIYKTIGVILSAVGSLLLGASARDNSKSSEAVGAAPVPPATTP